MATRQRQYPYGDAFIVDTPHLDKFADRMYQQEQQDQARKRQEMDLVDKAMNEEIGTIRSIDRDEYINKYQKYKQLKKELLFNPKLKRNPKEYDKVAQETARAFADAKAFAGGSAEIADAYKGLAQGYMKNPDAYSDDATQRMEALRNTRFDDVRKSNLTDLSTYMYTGPKEEDIKALDAAKGKLDERYSVTKELPGGLESEVTTFQFYDNPSAIKSRILNNALDQRTARTYGKMYANTPKEEVESVMEAYDKMSPEEVELRTGRKEKPALKITENMTAAEKFATYQAAKTFVKEQPVPTAPKRVSNKEAILNRQLENAKELRNIDLSNRRSLEATKQQYRKEMEEIKGKNKGKEGSQILTTVYNSMKDQAVAGGAKVMNWNGKEVMYKVPNPAIVGESLSQMVNVNGEEKKRPPDEIYFKENGGVRYIFYDRDDKGNIKKNKAGRELVDVKKSGDITEVEFKTRVGRNLLPAGETVKQVDASEDDDDITPYLDLLED